jgi:hypothetical protein
MKKTITATTIALLAGAQSGYSQGQIFFSNYSTAAGLHAAVYPAQSAAASTYVVSYGGYIGYEEVGQSTAPIEIPRDGTKTYVGLGPQGTAYDAQLLAGPAGITLLSGTVGGIGLFPVGTIEHFHTQTLTAGMINGIETLALPIETYFSDGDEISVAVASWSSMYPSLAAAQQSGVSGVWGISPVEQTTAAGGLTVAPSTPINMPTTIESYSLALIVPEPGTGSLGVLGAAGLLFRRRK